MDEKQFDSKKLIDYWTNSSDEDYKTMEALYEAQRFNWTLFIGHLMIEKLLKAYYVKRQADFPPFTHNLLRIIEKCGIDLTDEDKLFFITVTTFNINARYDDYKMSFYKMCTPEYTSIWMKKIKEKQLWIKELISR
jgi:HEPN domain-containing protein